MATNEAFLDYPSEATAAPPDPAPTAAAWPATTPPTYTIDTTSRVISFVLGFALASLIAWLGSIPGEEVGVGAVSEPVSPPASPVVVRSIEEKLATTASAAEPLSPPPAQLVKPVEAQPQPAGALPTQPARGYRGVLALSSSPEGAEVVVNGRVVGQTPVVLTDLPVGSRALLVRREGYTSWSSSVRVVANQRTIVRAKLTPVQRTGN